MLSTHGRTFAARIFTPVADLVLRLGVGPDTVTVLGAIGAVGSALWFLPRGDFVIGAFVIAAFVLTDSVDGLMARALERRGVQRSTSFGAFLDSTLDRVADGAIFAGLVLWFSGAGAHRVNEVLALIALVIGSVVPYARARAEGLGMSATVGIAERADRLIIILVAILADGLGAPGWVMTTALAFLAVASAVTVAQRVAVVWTQAHPHPRETAPDHDVPAKDLLPVRRARLWVPEQGPDRIEPARGRRRHRGTLTRPRLGR